MKIMADNDFDEPLLRRNDDLEGNFGNQPDSESDIGTFLVILLISIPNFKSI